MPTPPWSELGRLLAGEVSTDEHARRVHARDAWPLGFARVRRGDPPPAPAAVVRPSTVDDVSTMLSWCDSRDVAVIPAAGRSGVCGGVAVDREALSGRDAVILDLTSLRGVDVAPEDLRATALAGTPGPAYEAALERHGLSGGHYPQSLHISSVGGWVACRSAGQFSTRYGKAEHMLAGADVVLASGELVSMKPQPSTAAGPDLLRLFCGSEGTLGVIVGVTMRVVRRGPRLPHAFAFATFPEGLDAIRALIQDGLRPAVVRLYDEQDTDWSFPGFNGCALVCVFEGPLAEEERRAAITMLDAAGASDAGSAPAEHWLDHRFDAVEQLEVVMRPDGPFGPHAIVDTLEVAGDWSILTGLYAGLRDAIAPHALGVLCHASHVYPDGACLYFTTAVSGDDEDESQRRYERIWNDAMEACLNAGGTITHHHGVGRLKARWLRRELGEPGWSLLRTLKDALDPSGILNPGNLGL